MQIWVSQEKKTIPVRNSSPARSDFSVWAKLVTPSPSLQPVYGIRNIDIKGGVSDGNDFLLRRNPCLHVGDAGQKFHFYDPRVNEIQRGPSMVSAMENPLVLGSVNTRTYLISENLCRHQFETFDHIKHSWSQRAPPPVPPSSQGTVMALLAHTIVRSDVVSILGLGVLSYHTASDSWVILDSSGPEKSVFPFRGFAQHVDGRCPCRLRQCTDGDVLGITRFQLESSGKGKQLSAINQHMAMHNLSGFSSSLPTIRGCFTLSIEFGLAYQAKDLYWHSKRRYKKTHISPGLAEAWNDVSYDVLLNKSNNTDPRLRGKSFLDHAQITVCMMGWLNKIFKGSRPKVSERQHHRNGRQGEQAVGGSSHKVPERQHHQNGRQGEQTVGNEPLTSRDEWSEIEDIDHAIALSLSEDYHKRRTIIDNESQLKEDEQLAKAIQDSWNVASPTRNGNGNLHRPITSPYSTGFRICAGCNTDIGYGRPLNCMGAFWHPECFRCCTCNQPIRDLEFSMSGGLAYHQSCYKEHHHPKCEIPTNAAGLIEYKSHPFWVQKYCPSHERDGTPRCCSCERLEPRDTQYAALDDGRKLCLECLDSAIMDTNECQPLYLDIQVFYEGLNMKVEQQVPLLLVERQALNVAMDGEKRGHHHMPETRGLCLSEEQTVSTILRRGGKRVMGMRTEPYKLTRRCEVTAILILYGLPRLLTGSILAHEMMHAWLRIKGYRTLSQDVEEGICQVLAHMWLDSQIQSMSGSNAASTSSSSSLDGSRSPLERKLGDFFKHQIESDTSPVYGNGYRAGKQAILKYGLANTLEHIRLTGYFPC
ncbi:hypothetical protein RHMOL_Rhmol07G0299000 [Rhododendron molle]|uniref:Uncharacterized protein n=1 Tax=Rhododendron molle TaxID=49168 RepID=A0ACC0N7A3_RHOML|nr:hypothetical protein RHMOL_Rhmol07G0299000 [Rhododendron molle]